MTTAVLTRQTEEIVDRTVAAIFAEIPAYSAVEDPCFLLETRAHVAEHQRALARCVVEERRAGPEDLLFVRPHVATRMGSISCADYTRACRVYLRVAVEALREGVRNRADAPALVMCMTSRLIDYVDQAATHAAELYAEIEQLELAGGEAVRRALLEDLIASRPVAPGPRQEAARAAGLEPTRPCLVVVAVPRVPVADRQTLHAVGRELARACRSHRAPLTVIRRDYIVVVAPTGQSSPGQLVANLDETYAGLARGGTRLAIGVSTVQSGLDGVSFAHDEAWGVAQTVGPEGGLFALPALSAFEYLTAFRDATAERLIAPAIWRFVDSDRRSGGVLTGTLLAYVAGNLNVKALSERLAIHVNTAHYRLGKIAEQTQRDLRRLDDVLELVIAIRLARSAGDRPAGVWR